MVGLSEEDLAELQLGAALLRADGWASFVTLDQLVSNWRRLGHEAADYAATVDDYTNDLTAREGLHLLLQYCHPTTAIRAAAVLEPLDRRFREGTDLDLEQVLPAASRSPGLAAIASSDT